MTKPHLLGIKGAEFKVFTAIRITDVNIHVEHKQQIKNVLTL